MGGGERGDRPDGPIFIVGAPRSGTTLVYSLLRSDPEFVQYEEGETRLLQCRFAYGPPWRDACYDRFMTDWLRSKQFERSGLEPESFREEAGEHRDSYIDLLRCFMERMASAQEKSRWTEKTPANIHHMRELAAAFPSSRFVHVVRDGRDVALSRRKLGWHVMPTSDPLRQLVSAAVFWQQLVQIGRKAGSELEDRYHELRFEDLVRDPEGVGGELGSFTGADVTAGLTGRTRVGALEAGYSAFDADVSGISRSPVERWREQLSDRERTALAACIGRTLRELGYPVPDGGPDSPPPLSLFPDRAFCVVSDLALRSRRWVRTVTPLRWKLRSPDLLDFE